MAETRMDLSTFVGTLLEEQDVNATVEGDLRPLSQWRWAASRRTLNAS